MLGSRRSVPLRQLPGGGVGDGGGRDPVGEMLRTPEASVRFQASYRLWRCTGCMKSCWSVR
jgi:hypothetical protein